MDLTEPFRKPRIVCSGGHWHVINTPSGGSYCEQLFRDAHAECNRRNGFVLDRASGWIKQEKRA